MGFSREMGLTKSELVLSAWVMAATVLLLVPLPLEAAIWRWPTLLTEVEDFGHPLMVAWLSHLGFMILRARRSRPSRAPWLLVTAFALGYGVVTELAQSFTGRDASVWDLTHDLIGAVFALLVHAGREASGLRRSGWFVLAAVTGVVIVTPLAKTIAAYVGRSMEMPVLWSKESWLLQRFAHWDSGAFPGLVMEEPVPDWRDWRTLEVRVRSRQPVPLHIVVRVHDRIHDQSSRDRYNGRFVLAPSLSTILRIPVEQIRTAPVGRQMDMDAIRGVIVFAEDATQTPPFEVEEVRLAR